MGLTYSGPMSEQQPSPEEPSTNVTPGASGEDQPSASSDAAAEIAPASSDAAAAPAPAAPSAPTPPAAPAQAPPAAPVWPPHAPPPAGTATPPQAFPPPAPAAYPPPAPQAYPGAAYPVPGYPAYPPPPQTSTSAIIGLVLAIASFIICPVIPAVVALILARSSTREIEESAGRIGGAGLNTATRIISWINIGLYALIIVGFAIFFVLAAILSAAGN